MMALHREKIPSEMELAPRYMLLTQFTLLMVDNVDMLYTVDMVNIVVDTVYTVMWLKLLIEIVNWVIWLTRLRG